MSIFENLEILTVTFKSEHIIESCLSQIDTNFKITIVENSDNLDFKKKMEERKNVKCILANENIGFGSAFNLGAKQINSEYILHINPDVKIDTEIIKKLYENAIKIDNLGILSPLEKAVGKKDDNSKNVRQNIHTLYMKPQREILALAKEVGFILLGKIDMVSAQYEYQYIYILQKPQ